MKEMARLLEGGKDGNPAGLFNHKNAISGYYMLNKYVFIVKARRKEQWR